MATGKITIKDVATAAGVSITTVSRVLNGHEDQMSEETQKRVLAAIQRLNYVPNRLASSLKNERSQTLGVIVTNIMNPFFTAVVRGIHDYVTSRGYDIFICNTDDNPELEAHYHRTLLSRRVDGLIVTKCSQDVSIYEKLAAERYPLVLIDRPIQGLCVDTVVVDNVGICEHVVDRLFELEHRRIGIITPPLSYVEPRIERIEGCRRAMLKHGLQLPPDLMIEVDFHLETGAEATRRLLSMKPGPTALFVLNTFLAIGALKELDKQNVKIPDDLSFVMFDDPEWSELVKPRISAVRQPTYEIGRVAARLTIERIERKDKPCQKICLNADFIARDSMTVCKTASN